MSKKKATFAAGNVSMGVLAHLARAQHWQC